MGQHYIESIQSDDSSQAAREIAADVVRDVCPRAAKRWWRMYGRRSLVSLLVQQRYFRAVKSALAEHGLPEVRNPKCLLDDFGATVREVVDRAAAECMAERIHGISGEYCGEDGKNRK